MSDDEYREGWRRYCRDVGDVPFTIYMKEMTKFGGEVLAARVAATSQVTFGSEDDPGEPE